MHGSFLYRWMRTAGFTVPYAVLLGNWTAFFNLQKFFDHMDPHVPNNKVYMLKEAGRGVSSVHDVWRER